LSDLFNNENSLDDLEAPLADRMRPQSLDEVIGQNHLLGEKGPLQNMLTSGIFSSIILWGPPGVGKTTIARLLADHSNSHFEQLSAIFTGVGDLKKFLKQLSFGARMAINPSFLLMKFIVLINLSRIVFYLF